MNVQEETQQQPIADNQAADKQEATTAAEPVKKSFDDDDGIMRVSAKEKKMGARIGYLINRLKSGQPCTLQACGSAVNTAIWMSSVVRSQMGDIHQVVSLTEKKATDDNSKERDIMGI